MNALMEVHGLLFIFMLYVVHCVEEISIHVINTPFETEMALLPLAGSYEHEVARNARQKEDNRYVDASDVSEEGKFAYDTAMRLAQATDFDAKTIDKKIFFQNLELAAWAGHPDAQETVAMAYLLGKILPLNISGARELYERLQEKGHPAGQMGMGFLHATGLGMEAPSQPLTLLYYTFAALGGNNFAQMALGYRYFHGINVENNCEQALHHYSKVASRIADHIPLMGGRSIQKIRLSEEWENPSVNTNMDDDLQQYYVYVAEKGDIQAQVILGQLHMQGGRGLPQDRALAFSYLKKAAEGGSASAHSLLGKIYLEGCPEVPQNNESAHHHFKQAADANNGMGNAGLGLIHLYGRGVPVDYKIALKYFKLAAEQTSVEGQVQLGIMLFHGLGGERDLVKAVKLFNQASQSGSVVALFYLAEINAMGYGVARVCRTSAELYKNVAERGRWGIQFSDAFNDYKAGQIDRALMKYLLLADLGYEVAQNNVAFILDKNEDQIFSANETYKRAIVYWERSASQGYHLARVKLGDYHYYGVGTEVDYEMAVNSYRQAEAAHSPQALFNLGYMHQQGLGVKQDLHLAKRFYDRALETSADAYAPVSLALMSVGVLYAWQQLTETFEGFSEIAADPEYVLDAFVENWDVLLISAFVIALIAILIVLQRLMVEMNRQRQLQRQNLQFDANSPGQNIPAAQGAPPAAPVGGAPPNNDAQRMEQERIDYSLFAPNFCQIGAIACSDSTWRNIPPEKPGVVTRDSRVKHQKEVFLTPSYDPKVHSRVLVIYTGGTIGMKANDGGAYAPDKDQHLYDAIKTYAHLHDQHYSTSFHPEEDLRPLVLPDCREAKKVLCFVKEYDLLQDSSNMTVREWVMIVKDIEEHYDAFDGFVVLHGTDTMSYTASALSFMLEHLGKPVVLTGSQIPIFEPRSDGQDNFINALVIAGCYDVPEVTIYFDRKLLRGNRSTKVDNNSFHAFETPNFRPLAEVGIHISVHQHRVLYDKTGQPFSVDTNFYGHVALLPLHPTIDAETCGLAETIRATLQPPIRGAVLETFGAGNCPHKRTDIMDALKEATNRGVLIVSISQCSHGAVDDSYETGKVLADIGVVHGHDMTREAGLAKLGYVLGKTGLTNEEQRAMLLANLRGELTVDDIQKQ